MKSNGRIFSYDVIRVVAVLLVVMIHISCEYVNHSSVSSMEFLWGNVFDSISRAAVPLFVMLSGALMLDEKKHITTANIVRYCRNIIGLLIIWSFVYVAVYSIFIPIVVGKEIASIKNILFSMIFGHYHLWYLYMIIGLYLLTPIFRLFVNRANKKYVLYFIILSIIFQFIIPLSNYIINKVTGTQDIFVRFTDSFYMEFVTGYTTYYLLGWYISNTVISKTQRRIIYIVGVMGVLVAFLGTQIFSTDKQKVSELFYSNLSINILFYSLAIFVFFYNFYKNRYIGKLHTFITRLSRLTFGVYAIHVIVIDFVNIILEKLNISFILLALPINWLLTSIISFGITYIISKIPVVKKIVKF